MIDWDRVAEFRAEIGEEDFAEIAVVFLEELGETIAALGAASGADALRDGYHGLKGAALNLGFAEVARLCAAAEAAPEGADLAAIDAACRASAEALRGRYPALAA